MLNSVFNFLTALFGSGIARFLTGAGLGVATFAALSVAVTAALTAIVTAFDGLPSAMAQIVLLSGFGNALNIVGTAILTRLALDSGALSIRKVL